jgi:hypothetical protein
VDIAELMRPRWRGQPGRLEVWYTTLTEPASGTGVWLHHEFVAPTAAGDPYVHGWLAVFPPGTAPVVERFGPHPWSATGEGVDFAAPGVTASAHRLAGRAGQLCWDLRV